MRIIAGRYRGRRLLDVPAGIRPSSDRLREALFNVLGAQVEETVWLDPFAGSGAVGLEALSRGARHVIFGDRNPDAIRLMRGNLELCRVEGGYEIHEVDGFRLLKILETPPLDFIFLDPPYDFRRHQKLLRAVARLSSFQRTTRVIFELFKKTPFQAWTQQWSVQRRLVTGDSQLLFLAAGRPGKRQDR